MKIKYYIITGLLALIFFLILNIPAAPVIDRIKDKIPQLAIQNVSGTLWSGSAQQISVQAKHIFKDVSWSICISHLIFAELSVELEAIYNQNPLSGRLIVDFDKNIQAENIKTTMDAKALGQMITLPMGEVAGNISIDLDTLSWQQGGTPSASGVIKWDNASITIAETAQLGDVTINLSEAENKPVNAKISNQGGHISIDGLASIGDTSDYELDLSFTPSKNASNNLKDSLRLFAKPQSNGSFILKNSGNLKQLGLM